MVEAKADIRTTATMIIIIIYVDEHTYSFYKGLHSLQVKMVKINNSAAVTIFLSFLLFSLNDNVNVFILSVCSLNKCNDF